MYVSVRELHKDFWEGGMIMDPLMMWPLLLWIFAVMLGRLHEYSESLKGRWLLKVISEGNRGQGSAFISASIISKITVRYQRIKAKLNIGLLLIYPVNGVFYI